MATYFYAELQMQCPSDWTKEQARRLVESIISSMQEKCSIHVDEITEEEFNCPV